jgi:hypothetical protein
LEFAFEFTVEVRDRAGRTWDYISSPSMIPVDATPVEDLLSPCDRAGPDPVAHPLKSAPAKFAAPQPRDAVAASVDEI